MSYHYNALRQLIPKCFSGPGEITVDFTSESMGENSVKFTPLIGGAILTGADWNFGDGTAHSIELIPTHDYGA